MLKSAGHTTADLEDMNLARIKMFANAVVKQKAELYASLSLGQLSG
jgi:hypothetical protein